jgi:hypothetical protein
MDALTAKHNPRQRFSLWLPIQSLSFVQPLSEENDYV